MDLSAIVEALDALYETVLLMAGRPRTLLEYPEPTWDPPTKNKSPAVIAVMKHLPYVNEDIRVAPYTVPLNYRNQGWENCYWLDFEPFGRSEERADVTADDIALTIQDHNLGSILLLDTTTGNVRIIKDTDSRPVCSQHDAATCPPLCRHRQGVMTRPAVDVLREWRENFRSLTWFWNAQAVEIVSIYDEDSMDDMIEHFRRLKIVYRDYGWPNHFRTAKCREALRDVPWEFDGSDEEEEEEEEEEEDNDKDEDHSNRDNRDDH